MSPTPILSALLRFLIINVKIKVGTTTTRIFDVPWYHDDSRITIHSVAVAEMS